MSRNLFANSLSILATTFFVTAAVSFATISHAEAKSPDSLKHESGPQKGKEFDKWGVNCEKQPDGKTEKCFAQQVQTTDKGQRYLTMAVGYMGPKGEPMLVAVVPFGVTIESGATYKVDADPQVTMPYQQCTELGCQAVAILTDAALRTITGGQSITIGVLPWGQTKAVEIPVPLKGLAAAVAASR